jgi:hypothetical protein
MLGESEGPILPKVLRPVRPGGLGSVGLCCFMLLLALSTGGEVGEAPVVGEAWLIEFQSFSAPHPPDKRSPERTRARD